MNAILLDVFNVVFFF